MLSQPLSDKPPGSLSKNLKILAFSLTIIFFVSVSLFVTYLFTLKTPKSKQQPVTPKPVPLAEEPKQEEKI